MIDNLTDTSYKEKKLLLFLLLFVAALGVATSKIHTVAFFWAPTVALLGFYLTIKTRNSYGAAHLFAGYIMGAEVYFRMSWSGLPWDFAKYAIIILLFTGLLVDKRERKLPLSMFVFLGLLLPGIFLTFDYYNDAFLIKKAIAFNLLGPLVLVTATFYFYKMTLNINEFVNLSRAIVLGVLTMSVLVLFNVGDYTAVKFTYSSSAGGSGGFSGNEVSMMFGVGILMLGINLLLNKRLFIYKSFDILLFLIFTFQALMTFSRGGLFSALISLSLGIFVYYFSNIHLFILFLKKSLLKIILIILLGIGVFFIVNEISGNKLYSRYFNVNESGQQLKEDYSTGREDIVIADIKLFKESNYVGVGVGVSKLERSSHKNFAAHVEYSRLLAEHGILGLFIILILLGLPLLHFLKRIHSPLNNLILVSFSSLSLLTMLHAATRTGVVGFFFGLAFILIVKEQIEKR